MQNNEQLDVLYKLKKEIEKSNNEALVHTINQVIKKVYLNQYTLSFVGHFSAGKSTLINLLLEQDILPSSPVPTTSNTAIVSVSKEEEIIANLEYQKYAKLKTYDDVKIMNRLNIDVESIEIKFPSNKFNLGFTLQDTPGVDSNVSTHQSTTEQFLYTSNMIVYIVDYNHVQSALNFQFMKRMNQVGIPIIFVINQIDKHNENEISFDTFKQKVEQSIQDWDIKVAQLFYVSKFDHPNNQLHLFSEFLVEQDKLREPIEDFVTRIIEFIHRTQLSHIQEHMQNILDALNINESEFEESYKQFQQNQAISEEAQLLNHSSQLLTYLKEKRKNILDNAYIMTHDMREDIRYYLESMALDFKVGGLLNKKKKTEEERAKRLQIVVDRLQEKVNRHIRQPMREDLSFVTRFIHHSEVNQRILNQHYEIEPTLISNLYQVQTSINNTYVLTFSDDVLKAIARAIEKQSDSLFKDIIEHTEATELSNIEDNDAHLYEQYLEFKNLKQSLTTENYKHYYIHINDSLDKLIDRTETHYKLNQSTISSTNDLDEDITSTKDTTTHHFDIQKALAIIEPVPLFNKTKQDIKATLQRIDNKIVKIGVFGTFSAGKSSLINALLGDHYLVSSPNPTTAATTEISYGHDSQITLKTNTQLLNELNQLLEYQNVSFNSLEKFMNSNIESLKQQLEKNQLAFITSVEKHFSMYQDMLTEGITHTISQNEIKHWSAEDEYATFVKTVHIQLPLDWLKDKIIVDSLGLHSNNQRHTNETERILTSSDLILYVSYFNHSFTDNDKAFIEHMKDINQLNEAQTFKMIINAIDLAETNEDLIAVEQYVKDALSQVNLPSELFGVSSKRALETKDEGILKLKESINHFVETESKTILEKQMIHQIEQMRDNFNQIIYEFKTNQTRMLEQQQQLETYKNKTPLTNQIIHTSEQHTKNEVEEQIYHLNKRLQLQLLDEVKKVYNSQMTQNNDFNDEKKRATKMYLDQVHQRLYLEQTLLVERIKTYFTSQLDQQIAPTIQKLNSVHVLIQPHFKITAPFTDDALLRISLEEMLSVLPKQLSKRKILNANAQRELQEMICTNTLELLQPSLNVLKQQLNYYVSNLTHDANIELNQLNNNVLEQINDLLSKRIDNSLIEQLETVNQQLEPLLN
ncbi:dynamin family protein [Staphylococcus hominis]|uniref:dynamin family protein n=1 Tax=Staphylococcus hominis TaxID=1290 RepID=UPI0006B924B6|nr:dynamin family protein [Staphylococcus hominis]OFN14538.1 dynamin family protein [Staphylococcus sp. HMSC058D09]OFR10819.1 dynamin family protein [Staphylococcus sp. HMSC078E07]KPG87728.1 dynamin family protein [Staphylococcus hominis]MCI2918441.1 dynamin family protein [Staphylococcus hominis]MDK7300661.1 dynamin family protein [Staphylococcus hominis]